MEAVPDWRGEPGQHLSEGRGGPALALAQRIGPVGRVQAAQTGP